MNLTIEQSGPSDLKITCDVMPVDMVGKALFVRPKEPLPYRHFQDILKSLRGMFPETVVVIIPPNLIISAENKESALAQMQDLMDQIREAK